MRLWRQPGRSGRRRTDAGRPASTAWPYTQRCSAAVLLLVGGTESPVSRACRIHTDQVHRAGGARAAESTLNQQQHPGRPLVAAASSAGGSVPRVLEREGVAPVPCDCCTLHTPLCAGIAALFAAPGLCGRERYIKIVRSRELLGGESIAVYCRRRCICASARSSEEGRVTACALSRNSY